MSDMYQWKQQFSMKLTRWNRFRMSFCYGYAIHYKITESAEILILFFLNVKQLWGKKYYLLINRCLASAESSVIHEPNTNCQSSRWISGCSNFYCILISCHGLFVTVHFFQYYQNICAPTEAICFFKRILVTNVKVLLKYLLKDEMCQEDYIKVS